MLSVSSLTLWLNAIRLNVSHYVDFRIEMNQRQSVDPWKKLEKEQLSSLWVHILKPVENNLRRWAHPCGAVKCRRTRESPLSRWGNLALVGMNPYNPLRLFLDMEVPQRTGETASLRCQHWPSVTVWAYRLQINATGTGDNVKKNHWPNAIEKIWLPVHLLRDFKLALLINDDSTLPCSVNEVPEFHKCKITRSKPEAH